MIVIGEAALLRDVSPLTGTNKTDLFAQIAVKTGPNSESIRSDTIQGMRTERARAPRTSKSLRTASRKRTLAPTSISRTTIII